MFARVKDYLSIKKIFSTIVLLLTALNVSSQQIYNVISFGAEGDGEKDDAAAIQRAIDECSSQGGGTVLFPRNHTFLAGPIELKSNVELYLETTSVLKANPDESIYNLSAFGENRGEGMLWLWADGAENITISGRGTIHGNGIRFMGAELDDSYELKPLKDPTFDPRPHVLTLTNVKNIVIRDVTITEGAYWTVHLVGCDGAVIDGIQLLNNLKIRNGDGIDLDHSKNVRIANCYITSGDDCICLKNRRESEQYGSCHDIVVSNCVMASRSCAIKIGSENMDSIYNVMFDNCIITRSNRGLGIQNRDEGTVTDVTFSNIQLDCRLWSDVWWGKAEPIYVTSYPRANGNHKDANWRFPKGQIEGRCGEVSRIRFNNITATSENGCFIGGDTPAKVNNIMLDNVTLTMRKQTAYDGGQYDKRPCRGEGFVKGPVHGLYVEQASKIIVRDFSVDWGQAEFPNRGRDQYFLGRD
ncbi:MAG: right-handed parallel beta-helix repeat-containing protein [Prevotella sp.]|nr:right-handed parallel beta-helix repeat-containing protein [Prevotella sp.]